MKLGNYPQFIFFTRYAKFIEEENRRETWPETVNRYCQFWVDEGLIDEEIRERLFYNIVNLRCVPSMRALMTAGEALRRDNAAGYNCGYLEMDKPSKFAELTYTLMCGTGPGFSVERDVIKKLPAVAEEFFETETVHVVEDSKYGWERSVRVLVSNLYGGNLIQMDYSKIRPKGARLKTFGGRASGPEPLKDLHDFMVRTFKGAAGRKLTDLEVHDICNKIGEIVVVGGVRRSAEISLSSPTSDRMRDAKTGDWFNRAPWRRMANNSACYDEKPDFPFFMSEMLHLYKSYSGERGFFNREAAKNIVARNGRRDVDHRFGCNPCSEIILRPQQFCNLSEVIVRPDDTLEELLDKVAVATIMGTLQSTLTNFRSLSPEWKRNCEEERLLGVSLTGIMDHPVLSCQNGHELAGEWLRALRDHAIEVNAEHADRLGINRSAAITCVKPSGTVSQLALCASGLHPNYAKRYIRTVRQDNKDPVTQFLIDQGVPHEPCQGSPDTTTIFSFALEIPEGAVTRKEIGAIEQLEIWKTYQEHWCEHKPSVTVYYTEEEFFGVCGWVWNNWDIMSGISLLPYDNGTYAQAPYQEVSQREWEEVRSKFPDIDWSKLNEYERGDTTTSSQELACTGGACEL